MPIILNYTINVPFDHIMASQSIKFQDIFQEPEPRAVQRNIVSFDTARRDLCKEK
jgi:hypothetical protein